MSNDLDLLRSARLDGEARRVPLAERDLLPGVPGWLPCGEEFPPKPSNEKSSARSSSGSCRRCSELEDLSAGCHSRASSRKLSKDVFPASRTVEVDPVESPVSELTGLVALPWISPALVSLETPRGGNLEYRSGSDVPPDELPTPRPPLVFAAVGDTFNPFTSGSLGVFDSAGDDEPLFLIILGDGNLGEIFDMTGDDDFFGCACAEDGFKDEPESEGGNGGSSRPFPLVLPCDEEPALDVTDALGRSYDKDVRPCPSGWNGADTDIGAELPPLTLGVGRNRSPSAKLVLGKLGGCSGCGSFCFPRNKLRKAPELFLRVTFPLRLSLSTPKARWAAAFASLASLSLACFSASGRNMPNNSADGRRRRSADRRGLRVGAVTFRCRGPSSARLESPFGVLRSPFDDTLTPDGVLRSVVVRK